MATDPEFIEYVVEQAALGTRVTFKKMFGEYALYLDGKTVALVCDNSVYLKSTAAAERLVPSVPWQPPYSGAKNHPVIDEILDDSELLQTLLLDTAALLPTPKPKTFKNKPVRRGRDDRLKSP